MRNLNLFCFSLIYILHVIKGQEASQCLKFPLDPDFKEEYIVNSFDVHTMLVTPPTSAISSNKCIKVTYSKDKNGTLYYSPNSQQKFEMQLQRTPGLAVVLYKKGSLIIPMFTTWVLIRSNYQLVINCVSILVQAQYTVMVLVPKGEDLETTDVTEITEQLEDLGFNTSELTELPLC